MRIEKSLRYTVIQEWIDRVVYLKQHIDSKSLLSDWQILRASSRSIKSIPGLWLINCVSNLQFCDDDAARDIDGW